jgi:hypothetical protein
MPEKESEYLTRDLSVIGYFMESEEGNSIK